MMSMARLRLCSHIVLYDFDRFGRDRVKMLSDFRDLERLGIEVHDCTDGQLTHDVAGQKALRADAEVRAISRRVLDGMTDRAANEELYNMPRRAPIGYKPTPGRPGQPAKDPVLAPKIAEVFDRFDKGESEGSLARWWRQQTGRPARPSTIRLMLRNEYYAGVAWFNRTSNSKIHGRYQKDSTEWVSRAHDQPIVDRDVFDRVQAQLDTRAGRGRPYGGTPQHSLTGILTCAKCGHRLMVHAGTPARAAMLSCETCKKYRSYSQVEKALQALLRAVPLGAAEIVHAKSEEPQRTISAINADIEAVEAVRGRVIVQHELGRLPERDYRAAIAETDVELARLEEEMKGTARSVQQDALIKATEKWLQTVRSWTEILDADTATAQGKRRIYELATERILVDLEGRSLAVHWAAGLAPRVGQAVSTVAFGRGAV